MPTSLEEVEGVEKVEEEEKKAEGVKVLVEDKVKGEEVAPGPGEAEGVGGAELPDHRQGRHRHAVHEVPSHWVPWVEVEHKEAGERVTQLPGAEVSSFEG